MDSNNNQMKLLPKDDNGYIINDTDPNKISADFLPLISEIKKIIIDILASSLHSIYLTGSVPRGVAEIKKSDLDVFAILNPGVSDENTALKAISKSIKKVLRTTDLQVKLILNYGDLKKYFQMQILLMRFRLKILYLFLI